MPFAPQADVMPAHHLAVLVLPDGHQRDEFRTALAERGIQTSLHYPPIHGFAAYRQLGTSRPLPRTEAVEPRLVTLPLYPHMSDDEVCVVTESVVALT